MFERYSLRYLKYRDTDIIVTETTAFFLKGAYQMRNRKKILPKVVKEPEKPLPCPTCKTMVWTVYTCMGCGAKGCVNCLYSDEEQQVCICCGGG